MKKILTVMAVALMTFNLAARDFFNEAVEKILVFDADGTEKIIKEWEKAEKVQNNFDYHVACLNLHMIRAAQNQEVYGYIKTTTKSGKETMSPVNIANREYSKLAAESADKALKINPDRLDIYFAKHEVLYQSAFFAEVLESCTKMVTRSKQNKNKWYWENNSCGIYDMLDEISRNIDRMGGAFSRSEKLDAPMKKLVDLECSTYPKEPLAYNHKATYYLYKNDFDTSIKISNDALKLAKDDVNTLITLYNCYYAIDDTEHQIECLERIEKSDNAEARAFATSRLKELR